MFKTTLHNVHLCDEDDWVDLIGEEAYRELLFAAYVNAEVVVTDVECEGDSPVSSYYNVTLSGGTVIPGLQGVHLRSIEQFHSTAQYGAVFTVEMQFDKEINYQALEPLIKKAIQEIIDAREDKTERAILVGVNFTTSYPIPK